MKFFQKAASVAAIRLKHIINQNLLYQKRLCYTGRMAQTFTDGDLRSAALDPATEKAARAFLRALEGKYPVVESILYGSRARGDFTQDSDADIAVILRGDHGDRVATSLDMAGIAFHVMLETGVMVQGLPLWQDEVARPETFANPALIKNILRDGIHL